jgi:DNA-binding transcriptional regulator YhcF (GntR family)
MRANKPDGAPNSKEVYGAIYSYIAHWNMAPTIRELAQELDCGHSTVQRRIIELERDGSIVVYQRRSRGITLTGKKG